MGKSGGWSAGTSSFILSLCLILPASGQTVITPLARPDPASVTIPDLAAFAPTPSDVRRFDDYFYFHKDGVSYARAFADMEQCRVNATLAQLYAAVPDLIPVGDIPTSNPQLSARPYQLGGLFGGFLIAEAEADYSAATNRKCMAYKGYARYGTSRALFKQIDSGTDTEKEARKALIAAGPKPAAEAIEQ